MIKKSSIETRASITALKKTIHNVKKNINIIFLLNFLWVSIYIYILFDIYLFTLLNKFLRYTCFEKKKTLNAWI